MKAVMMKILIKSNGNKSSDEEDNAPLQSIQKRMYTRFSPSSEDDNESRKDT